MRSTTKKYEPTEGVTRCDCGCRYWDKTNEDQNSTWRCHSCKEKYHFRMDGNV